MPNLFPEGKNQPMYNTVDAALLYIVTVYELYKRTEDIDFINEARPVMVSIIANYIKGTDYSIKLDSDGLITAGDGIDLVTWMDARCGDVTPTSRHGKPVEINAYWYNCLTIMDIFKKELGKSDEYLKVNDYSDKAKNRVRMSLESINGTLRAGCIGQIAEIYDGLRPVSSRGCFAQAWSVGEILKVYDALEGNYGF